MSIAIIIITGFFAGIISGMGIGGGALLIPALHIFSGVEHKVAQSINLFYFIPTAISALVIHIKNKNIIFKPLIPVLIFGVIGAIGGGWLAITIHSEVLRKMFGIFLLLLAIRELYYMKTIKVK